MVEPKTVRAAKLLIEDLRFLERLTRDKYPPLQHVWHNHIALTRYGLGYATKGGYMIGLYMPRKIGEENLDRGGGFHARYGL